MSDNYRIESRGISAADKKKLHVTFEAHLQQADWEELQQEIMEKIAQGFIEWDFDIQAIEYLNSAILGTLVAINGIVLNHSGHLNIILDPHSQVAKVIEMTRLDRVLNILEA